MFGQIDHIQRNDEVAAGPFELAHAAREHANSLGGIQYGGDPLGRVGRIDRYVHSTGLEHRPPRDHQLGAAPHRHPDGALSAHARLDQRPSQPVRDLVQLPVGQLALPIDYRDGVRISGNRCCQRVRRQAHQRAHLGARPLVQHQILLIVIQQADLAHNHRRIGNHSVDHAAEPTHQPLDAGSVVQICGIGDRAGRHERSAAFARRCLQIEQRTRVPAGHFTQVEFEVEPGGTDIGSDRLDVKAVQLNLGAHVVLEGQCHLEQRMVRRGSRRIEPLNQQLERHILIGIRIQCLLPHPFQHFAEPQRRIDAHPQHPGVDEEPDQILECLIIATGDRSPQCEVVADAGSVQRDGDRGLQDHRHRCVVCGGDGFDARPGFGIDAQVHRIAAIAGRGRAWPIRRKRHHLGEVSQFAAPVRQLAGEHTVGIGLGSQPALLPQRVIGVLHR
ncbi:hypothetical protein MBOE_04120 [Mycolicibacterium boenickei]|uniref:Uncharacterized protein n=1 Tax=Mycolicibacterium boenickei TaxID=146017 RepID=A0ABM7IPN6_9MYCO|nr:hypothetical protein MBOE_04120 [Mycolicibacterium boenickei]